MYLFRTLILLFFLSFFIDGCGHEKSFVTSLCPKEDTTVAAKANIKSINIFMEVSGSMKGFMPESNITTDFQYFVPDLIGRFKKDIPNTTFYSLAQKNVSLEPMTIEDAKNNIAYRKFSIGQVSSLPEMFDAAISRLKEAEVSILITDAIYTPTQDKTKLRSQVISDISALLSPIVNKNYSISVFCFRSRFNRLISPYYLFVFGKSENIQSISKKIERSIAAVGDDLISKQFFEERFGYGSIKPFYSIIPYVDNTGAGEAYECPELDGQYIVMTNLDVAMDAQFWVGLNLSDLPSYVTDSNYLKTNIEILPRGIKAEKVGEILSKAEFSSKVQDESDKDLVEKCTHFIRIKIFEMDNKTGEIDLNLKKNRPGWISNYSHSSSDSAEIIRDKTFGLDNIISGFEDAYNAKEIGYFFKELKIIVIKN